VAVSTASVSRLNSRVDSVPSGSCRATVTAPVGMSSTPASTTLSQVVSRTAVDDQRKVPVRASCAVSRSPPPWLST
jgi:hypothetical protein